jgi:tetratricopeptide (TPR) repeat protein
MYASCFETDFEAIEYLKKIIELDENDVIDMHLLGNNYLQTLQYEKAISILERSLEIYNEWDSKPYWVSHYTLLGKVYHETGQYRKEKRLYKKAEQDFPDDLRIINRQAILALSVEDTISANQYIEKLITGWKGNSETDASISRNLARIYLEAGLVDKAEAYYRKALLLEPENHGLMNQLAALLIRKDNINEEL